eukprot:190284-Ditylum_brightwellii.AAC.1
MEEKRKTKRIACAGAGGSNALKVKNMFEQKKSIKKKKLQKAPGKEQQNQRSWQLNYFFGYFPMRYLPPHSPIPVINSNMLFIITFVYPY